MHRFQMRKVRPTFQTAHARLRGDNLSIRLDQFLSLEERERELEKVHEDLETIVKRQFPRTQNLEYALLKAHLIVEHALTQYIRCSAMVSVDLHDIRFTFSQKLEIAYLLGFGLQDTIMLPTIERLNTVRNQVAHKFVLNRAAVDEMLRINSEDYHDFELENDRQRIRMLRRICEFICGMVTGQVYAFYVSVENQPA